MKFVKCYSRKEIYHYLLPRRTHGVWMPTWCISGKNSLLFV